MLLSIVAVSQTAPAIVLYSEASHEIAISLAVSDNSVPILIDWGDGNAIEYQVQEYKGGLYSVTDIYGIATDSINVYGNITAFNCSETQATYLNVSNAESLIHLSCTSNLLSEIDLSKNPSLQSLYCKGNKLATLDISNNQKISELECSENNLTISDLPSFRSNFYIFSYSPQNEMFMPKKEYRINENIDLSSELHKRDIYSTEQPTAYRWKTQSGTELAEGVDYEATEGVFTITKDPGDSIYCEMQNPALPELLLKTENIYIDTSTPLSVSYSILANVNCHNSASAQARIEATGGTLPYTSYIWPDSVDLQQRDSLSAGIYQVTVTDSKGAAASVNVEISEYAGINASSEVMKNVTCFGGADGAVSIKAEGGDAPYRFTWPNGDTLGTRNNLPAGAYTVTVADANSCTSITSFIVDEKELSVGFEAYSGCAPHYIADFKNTSKGAVNYLWEFGDGDTSSLENPSHRYLNSSNTDLELNVSLTAESEYGCIESKNTVISIYKKPVADFLYTGTLISNVPIEFENTTQNFGYQETAWEWSYADGTVFDSVSDPVHVFSAGDDYSVRFVVETENGCTDTASRSISIGQSPTFTIASNGSHSFCKGDSVRLSIVDLQTFSVQWMKNGQAIENGQDSAISVSETGNYYALISRDTLSFLSDTVFAQMYEYPPQFRLEGSYETVICDGDSLVIELQNSDIYSYKWEKNGKQLNINSNRIAITEEGKYSATVSNRTCKTASLDTITVQLKKSPKIPPALYVSDKTVFCEGDSVNLYIQEKLIPYRIEWLKDSDVVSTSGTQLTVNQSGTYVFRAVNEIGCSATTDPVEVEMLAYPEVPSIAAPANVIVCEGDSIGLSTDSLAGIRYVWKRNGAVVSEDTNIFFAKNKGAYTLENYKGECGTHSKDTIQLYFRKNPVAPKISNYNDLILCGPDSVLLSVPETDSLSHRWLHNNELTGNKTEKYTAWLSGSYAMMVTDSSGCHSISDSIIISITEMPPVPQFFVDDALKFCKGDSAKLFADKYPGYEYIWKNGDTKINKDTNSISAKSSGKYSLSLSKNGCENHSEDSISVTVYPLPEKPIISKSGKTSFCQGDSIIFSIPAKEGFSYRWKINGVEQQEHSNALIAKKEGTYSVQTVNKYGCIASADSLAEIKIYPIPEAPAITCSEKSSPLCDGDTVYLFNNILKEGLTYNWIKNNGYLKADNDSLLVISDGSYSLEISQNGCLSLPSNEITLEFLELPKADVHLQYSAKEICKGDTALLSISYEGNYDFQWYFDDHQLPRYQSPNMYVYSSGVYQAVVSSPELECVLKTDPVEITVHQQPEKPVIDNSGYTENTCQGEFITLYATNIEEFDYQWYRNGIEVESNGYSYSGILDEGNYKLKATNKICSSISDGMVIKYNAAPDKPSIYYLGSDLWYLQADVKDAEAYKWYFEEQEITGADKFYYEAGTQEGAYRVAVKQEGECYAFSEILNIPEDTWFYVATEDMLAESLTAISPNPNNGIFTVLLQNAYYGSAELIIYSIAGNAVYSVALQKETETYKHEINVSWLSDGVYFVKLKIDNNAELMKIVVEH